MKVKYDGTSDVQEFSAADFKKADVEGRKITFPKGKAVEVSDEVGQALISKEGIFGDFNFSEADDDESDEENESLPDVNEEVPPASTAPGSETTPPAKKTTSRSTRDS